MQVFCLWGFSVGKRGQARPPAPPLRAMSCAARRRSPATAAAVQGAEIDARAQLLRAGARMLPEITDASCAAMGCPVLLLEITGAASGARCGP